MPVVTRYRKRRRTNYVRRPRRKPYVRRSRRMAMSIVPRTVGPPKSMFAKLRWTYTYSASVAAAASSLRQFNLNSLFDPDYTGVGDQPYYFDQYSAMFGRYRVYGVKMNLITTCSSSTSNLYHPLLTISTYCDTLPSWSATTLQSAKRSIRKLLIPGQSNIRIGRYYDLRSIAGVSKSEYNVAEVFQALTTASPTRPMLLSVNLTNNDGVATITWSFNLQLTFYTKFFDNVEPSGS